MIYSIALLMLFSFQVSQSSINQQHHHRKVLDPEIQIDEILPTGVIPIVDIEPATISWTSIYYGAGALGIGYGVITAYLLYMAYHISKKTTWAYWYTLESKNISNEDLTVKLMQTLFEKYKYSCHKHARLLGRLINELDQELSLLHRFISCRSKIEQFKLKPFFINQDLVVKNALQSIIHLNKLKDLALILSRNAE